MSGSMLLKVMNLALVRPSLAIITALYCY